MRASRVLEARQEDLFDFLADLRNHWRMADRFIDVVSLERDEGDSAHGGRVRMRGPLGVRRTAATRVLTTDPPRRLVGVALLGRGTRAFVRWKLRPADGGTRVTLEATVDRLGRLDAALLALGGRAWLERRFGSVLERLADHFENPPRERSENRAKPAQVAR